MVIPRLGLEVAGIGRLGLEVAGIGRLGPEAVTARMQGGEVTEMMRL